LEAKRTKSQYSILEKGKELFFKHGISKVSVEEVCQEASVSKMTFYRHFKNKHELAFLIVKDLTSKARKQYNEIMTAEISFEQKMLDFFEYKSEQANHMSFEFINDLYLKSANNKEIIEFLNKESQRGQTQFIQDFEKAQQEGYIRNDMPASFILHMMGVIQKEVQNPTLQTITNTPRELTQLISEFFMHGIFTKTKES